MVKLSDRLQCIANRVLAGERVADIGTDHGFLPIYLLENEISPFVIAADVNSGPLKKAEVNFQMYGLTSGFDLRLGSGLEPVEPGEADTVVMAGMGGILMAELLQENLEKTRSFKKFILQPRNAQDKLRLWLEQNRLDIVDETLVNEGRYTCEVITAVPGDVEDEGQNENDNALNDHTGDGIKRPYPVNLREKIKQAGRVFDPETVTEYEISPLLIQKKDPLLSDLIRFKIRIEEDILEQMEESSDEVRRSQVLGRISNLKKLLLETVNNK